jgi:hypothetical protein
MRYQSIRRLLAGAAFGLLGLLGSAQADIIDFESLPADSLFGSGATFNQATFYQFTQNGDFGGAFTAAGLAVALPPSGNATQFYGALNDSSLSFTRTDNNRFSLDGFDAAYLSPFPQDEGTSAGRIFVTAINTNGQTLSTSFDFGTAAADGSYSFFSFSGLSGFTDLTSVTFVACVYEGDGCVNPGANASQFALDNVIVTAVPEPSTYAMMVLGMLVVGWSCRPARRRT